MVSFSCPGVIVVHGGPFLGLLSRSIGFFYFTNIQIDVPPLRSFLSVEIVAVFTGQIVWRASPFHEGSSKLLLASVLRLRLCTALSVCGANSGRRGCRYFRPCITYRAVCKSEIVQVCRDFISVRHLCFGGGQIFLF